MVDWYVLCIVPQNSASGHFLAGMQKGWQRVTFPALLPSYRLLTKDAPSFAPTRYFMASIIDQLTALFRPGPALPSISAPELQQQLKGKSKPLVLDVRTPGETAHGIIGGARLIPLDTLAQRASELPRNQPIVCVCRSGRRSATACKQLAALGFSDVTNLSGGMHAWQAARLPVKFKGGRG
jgi:rhodanese-related sulfurtransferase